MGFMDFFRFGRSNKNIDKTELSQEEKERILKLRHGMASNFDKSKDDSSDVSITDIHDMSNVGNFTGMIDVYSKYVYANITDKSMRLEVYREMAKYPEIAFAIDEYVDEAMQLDDTGKFMTLVFKNESLKSKDMEVARKTLLAEFDYLMDEIIEIDCYFDQWFREYMIDAEVYFEKIFDVDNPSTGIVKIKKLLTERCVNIWSDPMESDEIEFFVYKKSKDNALNIPREIIAYANSGIYEYSKNDDVRNVLSFLEPARTTYRRLKLLEDALVIYRLVRAPERRIFKIDVGNLPKGRAEQYMKEIMTRYKQRKYFDPKSGDVVEGLDSTAMTEDFFFPVFQGGRSSEVTTLPGGQNLGDIEDVEYFLGKLYRGLKIPKSRFGEDNRFSIGDTNSEISREEMKFMKEVKRYTRRFSSAFKDIFYSHLELKGITNEYGIAKNDLFIKINENNLFQRFWEAKILELKFQNFEKFSNNMDKDETIFSTEMVLKKYLEWDDDTYEENERLKASERATKKMREKEDEEDDDEGDEE